MQVDLSVIYKGRQILLMEEERDFLKSNYFFTISAIKVEFCLYMVKLLI